MSLILENSQSLFLQRSLFFIPSIPFFSPLFGGEVLGFLLVCLLYSHKSDQMLRASHLFPQGSALKCLWFVPWILKNGAHCWYSVPSVGVCIRPLWEHMHTLCRGSHALSWGYVWSAGGCIGQPGMLQVRSSIGLMGRPLGGVWEPVSRTYGWFLRSMGWLLWAPVGFPWF